VYRAVVTSRTKMGLNILQSCRPFEYLLHSVTSTLVLEIITDLQPVTWFFKDTV
jgi:hypothetical protein